jgi:NodT family efflux transporter outer membrane factor (OMF) lipoprotein
MKTRIISSFLILGLLLSGCNTTPAYHKPEVSTPAAYKESAGGIWKAAQPKDDQLKGDWWKRFNDSDLNALEMQAMQANQNLAQAAANVRAAWSLVDQARSSFFPVLGISPSASRSGTPGTSGSSAKTSTTFSVPLTASWEPDFWGRVGNSVREASFSAQESVANMENARLSIQAGLASDYFQLRALDEQKKLLDDTATAYQKILDLMQDRFDTGIASASDVETAKSQLEAALALATDIGVSRAQLEHAIALLVGKSASDFEIKSKALTVEPPIVPPSTPSTLLERRPDIAAAERQVAAANEIIGLAKTAFFPSITLTGSGGVESSTLSHLFSASSLMWSLGGSASEVIFNGGLYGAELEQAKANYEAAVANYRQTVLGGFQQVEDDLAAIRLHAQERTQLDAAVVSSKRALDLEQSRYEAGIDGYLSVLQAQITLYGNERSLLSIKMEQLTDSVGLIKALGGGWQEPWNESPKNGVSAITKIMKLFNIPVY